MGNIGTVEFRELDVPDYYGNTQSGSFWLLEELHRLLLIWLINLALLFCGCKLIIVKMVVIFGWIYNNIILWYILVNQVNPDGYGCYLFILFYKILVFLLLFNLMVYSCMVVLLSIEDGKWIYQVILFYGFLFLLFWSMMMVFLYLLMFRLNGIYWFGELNGSYGVLTCHGGDYLYGFYFHSDIFCYLSWFLEAYYYPGYSDWMDFYGLNYFDRYFVLWIYSYFIGNNCINIIKVVHLDAQDIIMDFIFWLVIIIYKDIIIHGCRITFLLLLFIYGYFQVYSFILVAELGHLFCFLYLFILNLVLLWSLFYGLKFIVSNFNLFYGNLMYLFISDACDNVVLLNYKCWELEYVFLPGMVLNWYILNFGEFNGVIIVMVISINYNLFYSNGIIVLFIIWHLDFTYLLLTKDGKWICFFYQFILFYRYLFLLLWLMVLIFFYLLMFRLNGMYWVGEFDGSHDWSTCNNFTEAIVRFACGYYICDFYFLSGIFCYLSWFLEVYYYLGYRGKVDIYGLIYFDILLWMLNYHHFSEILVSGSRGSFRDGLWTVVKCFSY